MYGVHIQPNLTILLHRQRLQRDPNAFPPLTTQASRKQRVSITAGAKQVEFQSQPNSSNCSDTFIDNLTIVLREERSPRKRGNVVYQCAANFLLALSSQSFYYNYLSQFAMPVLDTEARIILAIEAIRPSKTLSRLKASAIYNVPETTLRDRMNGRAPRDEYRPPC